MDLPPPRSFAEGLGQIIGLLIAVVLFMGGVKVLSWLF